MALLKRNDKYVKGILSALSIKPTAFIAKGKFSLVYQDAFEDCVLKLSAERLTDRYFETMRGQHFPQRMAVLYKGQRMINGADTLIVLSRLRKLYNVRQSEAALLYAKLIISEASAARSRFIFDPSVSDAQLNYRTIMEVAKHTAFPHLLSVALCELAKFARDTPNCALDFHLNNFMVDDSGLLIFSDPFQTHT
ncbi:MULTISPECIES: hypothetical protein [unclassified Undibacterium]|nr:MULTISPECIES: hypothetical protein [unclassified Undibacterium]